MGDGKLLAPRCQALMLQSAIQTLAAVRRSAQRPWDLVAAGSGLFLLQGNGDGTFTASAGPSISGGANSVVIADVNGDGIPDVLCADSATAAVSVYLLGADGSFALPIEYAFPAPQLAILYQDLDGDGLPELTGLSATAVTVYGARGAVVGPACPASQNGAAFGSPALLGSLNVTAEGGIDLVVADALHAGLLPLSGTSSSLVFACGDGTLLAPLDQAASLINADFDRDGIPDLLALGGTAGSGAAILLLGEKTDAPAVYALPAQAVAGAVADLTGDGMPDAVVGLAPASVAVLLDAFLPN
jgi:hypothetical protein